MQANERVRTVYQGKQPDRVPLLLDLSHWYKKNRHVPFNLAGFSAVEQGLVDLHKQVGAVAYCEMGGFYSLETDDPAWRSETETVDGESRGVLSWLAECGVDCADAVTPAPMFAQAPAQMRAAAGPDLILSGGIPATIFGPTGSDAAFEDCVKRWLDTRRVAPRLFMAAGDQVPPDASFARIMRLRELVEQYGRY